MSALRLRLYRMLLLKARHFDANPAMKGILKDLDHFEPLQLRTLYSPSMQKSFVQLVKEVFRQPPKEGVDHELGFNVLRYLNQVDEKYYKALYPKEKEDAATSASAATSTSSSKIQTPVAPHGMLAVAKGKPLLQRLAQMAHRLWAMPILVNNSVPVPEAGQTTALIPTVAPPRHVPGAKEFHPLTPGVVLATHPLSEWPFPKCAMLILETGTEFVSALILNYPRLYHISDKNYVFPPSLRRQHCHTGGPILSYDMPPIPNYHIIHPYPAIRNSKVLLPDEERPVCLSTGEDIAAIGDFIRERKAKPEDFIIFAGSVIVPKADLQRQVQDGFWMPILASSEFVHASGRLGQLFWDGLMESCGGEFAHMPLISTMMERFQAEGAPSVDQ